MGDGPATAVNAAAMEQHEDAVESNAATDVNFILAILWTGGALVAWFDNAIEMQAITEQRTNASVELGGRREKRRWE